MALSKKTREKIIIQYFGKHINTRDEMNCLNSNSNNIERFDNTYNVFHNSFVLCNLY